MKYHNYWVGKEKQRQVPVQLGDLVTWDMYSPPAKVGRIIQIDHKAQMYLLEMQTDGPAYVWRMANERVDVVDGESRAYFSPASAMGRYAKYLLRTKT